MNVYDFVLPGGVSHLASTDNCANQAFSCGEKVFALQFHLEVTPEIINTWEDVYV